MFKVRIPIVTHTFVMGVVIALIILLLAQTAQADVTTQSINIAPSADTYIESRYAGSNYGTSAQLVAGYYQYGFTSAAYQETLMRFSLTSIPANSIINSAKLYLYATYPSKTSPHTIYNIPVANRTWTETGVTWNTKPQRDNTYPLITLPGVSMNSWAVVDITSYVQDMYRQGIDVEFDMDGAGQPYTDVYNSKEASSNQPYLQVTYSPTTGSISISSSPSGASIYLDDTYKGTTPKLLTDVLQGSHIIKLTLPGYNDWSYSALVPAGGTSYLSAELTTATPAFTPNPTFTQNPVPTLTPTPTKTPSSAVQSQVTYSPTTGSIEISSTPSSASIYLDGVYKGTTPNLLTGVPQGSHTIKLTLSGYNDWLNTNAIVAAGGASYYLAELTIATPTITLTQTPAQLGTIETRISGFGIKGDAKAGSIVKFTGTLEYYNTDLRWFPLTDASISVDIQDSNGVTVKTFLATTQSGLLSVGHFETPEWQIPAEYVNKSLTVMASFSSTGKYKAASAETKIYIASEGQADWTLVGGIGGAILGLLFMIAFAWRRRKPTESAHKAIEETSLLGEKPIKKYISAASAFGYKGATILYKVKIENNTSEPLSDIKVYPYVPNIFLLKEKEKLISLIEPRSSQTVTFEIRPTGECGDCNVAGRVNYYDLTSKKRQDIELEPKSLSIVCPMLHRKEVSEDTWRDVVSNLIKAEETTTDIPIEGEGLFKMISEILKDLNLYALSPSITKSRQIFKGTAKFYGEGIKGLQYAAQIEVVGGTKKSKLILKTWAEKEEALTGFYHGALDEIEKRVKVKEYIDDSIVQQHIHIGDSIGTQVKDSFVQRSNIGAGARKCPNCGREATANEKFCLECGVKL